MQKKHVVALCCTLGLLAGWSIFALAQDKPEQAKPAEKEQERQVKEAEVPKAALEALKKLAGGAAIKEFAEEIEHGHKFYEGSWAGPGGNIDALVTESGDLVELEETIAADQVPAAVRDQVQKEAGKDAKPTFEKKTFIMYEAHFKKDGKGREMMLTPDGRRHDEEGEEDQDEDEDEEKGKP